MIFRGKEAVSTPGVRLFCCLLAPPWIRGSSHFTAIWDLWWFLQITTNSTLPYIIVFLMEKFGENNRIIKQARSNFKINARHAILWEFMSYYSSHEVSYGQFPFIGPELGPSLSHKFCPLVYWNQRLPFLLFRAKACPFCLTLVYLWYTVFLYFIQTIDPSTQTLNYITLLEGVYLYTGFAFVLFCFLFPVII